MATPKFSSKEALTFGWNTFKNNFSFLISLFAGIAVIYLGLGALQSYADQHSTILSLIVSIIDWLLRLSISVGLIEIPLLILDGKPADYGHLFSGYRHLISYFTGSILYMLIILGGLLLLVVPGIIWAMRFQFFGYLIIDKGLRPVEALKASWAMTRGEVWHLFTFALLLALINVAGLLALTVGLLVSAPVSILSVAFVYRKLMNQHQLAPVSPSSGAAV